MARTGARTRNSDLPAPHAGAARSAGRHHGGRHAKDHRVDRCGGSGALSARGRLRRRDDELRAEGLGCDYESGDPASIPLFFDPTSTGIAAIDGPTTRLTVCRYAVTPDSDGVLVFQSGGPVPPETGAALARELAATEPGRRCSVGDHADRHDPGEDGTDRLTVQLDGCRLVFDATGGWGQAAPGLIDVLG